MAAKYDAANAPPGSEPPARPAWLPEKFKTPEDMVKSYAELEQKLSKAPAPAPATQATPPAAAPAGDPATPPAGVPQADFDAASAEFAEKGELSPETYAKLAAKGLTQEVVDSYIEGRKAVAARYDAAAFQVAGGEEQYRNMVTWAGNNLSPAEAAAYNAAVASGNEAAMRLAVEGLKARFTSANPSLLGGHGAAPANNGYESREQMVADMQNPLYAKDPAFRAKVEARVAATTAF